nr:hypothetical protein [Staphylococcus aureus]
MKDSIFWKKAFIPVYFIVTIFWDEVFSQWRFEIVVLWWAENAVLCRA